MPNDKSPPDRETVAQQETDECCHQDHCSPSFAGYLPESWSMLKDSIYAAQEAIRAGIENTKELLADHDVRLGRTTRGNRYTAEMLEDEIGQMQAALDGLQKPNGASSNLIGTTPMV